MDNNINIDLIQTNGNFDFTKLYPEINCYVDEMYHNSPLKININECKYLTAVEFSKAFQSDNISLSMLCINCRSLEAHWDSLQDLCCNLSSA